MGALVGGITAGAFHGAGNFAQAAAKYGKEAYYATKMATHGIVGGLRNVAMGGKFGQGFVSSAFVAGTSGLVGKIDASSPGVNLSRTAASAVIGGTASALGGGKFANGAISGAFARMYNDDMHARDEAATFKQRLNNMRKGDVIIGKRPLAPLKDVPGMFNPGGIGDKANIELLHEEVFYMGADGNPDSIGFRPNGLTVDANPSGDGYIFVDSYTNSQGYKFNTNVSGFAADDYGILSNNCQDYGDYIRGQMR
jgi:hypothetical protein